MTTCITAVTAPAPLLRRERHFGTRVLTCFAQRPASVAQMLREAVARHRAGDAVVCGAERLSWGELDALSARLANGLQQRGVGAGDRVALLLPNGVPFVLATLACARLRAVLVPLGVRSQTAELAHALSDCGAVCAFVDAALLARLPARHATPALREVCSVPEQQAAGGTEAALADWLGDARADLLADACAATAPVPAPGELAAIVYTSGTTGAPKGAMLTQLNIVHSALHYEAAMGLSAADRSLACVPLSHVTGLIAQLMTMLRVAGTLLILPVFKAAEFLALAVRERATHTIMVPAMYTLCLLRDDLRAHDLSAWRIGAFGGAPMPPATIAALAAQLPALVLMNAYGATETTSPATLMPAEVATRARAADAHQADHPHHASVGRVVACGDILVMDPHGIEVPTGASGEVWIKGPMVVPGYWNNPAATAASFVDGYWCSGDVGRVDAAGFLYLHDRLKDVINRGGFKVYPAELEALLAQHPAVLEAAVVGTPCAVLGERVHAFVTLRERPPEHATASASAAAKSNSHAADAAALSAFIGALVSDYKVPESWTLQTEPLPRNANGKLLKRELRTQLAQAR